MKRQNQYRSFLENLKNVRSFSNLDQDDFASALYGFYSDCDRESIVKLYNATALIFCRQAYHKALQKSYANKNKIEKVHLNLYTKYLNLAFDFLDYYSKQQDYDLGLIKNAHEIGPIQTFYRKTINKSISEKSSRLGQIALEIQIDQAERKYNDHYRVNRFYPKILEKVILEKLNSRMIPN